MLNSEGRASARPESGRRSQGQSRKCQSPRAKKFQIFRASNYIGLVYALVFSVTIFGERYTMQSVLGISLVVAGVLLAVVYGKPKVPEVIEETETAVV